VPLAIIPLGTANNIADSLGIRGAPEDLIGAWRKQRIVRIDTGVVEDTTGQCTFLESAGVGLIADGIAEGRAAISKEADVVSQLAHARQLYVDAVQRLQPKHYSITVDDERIDGEFLLVEVLNIPSVGPNVRLTPEVSPADGLLSVVMAGESDRDALVSYLQSRNGDGHDAGLKSWRAKRVGLAGAHTLHVDDDLREAVKDAVSISIQPASLAVLA
jgi:diacylglycerol kinase family enzyme